MTARRVVLSTAVERLRAAGVPSPEHDAAELLAHVLGTERGRLVLVEEVGSDALPAYDVELAVGPGVFVPRPETELLAGWAVEQAGLHDEPVVVDLCTGSGAVARSVAHEVPAARVHAVELDPAAHAWAERNLLGTGVDLRLGDMATELEELAGTVDVVVCNPPYVPLEAWESVAPEARDHDPHLALFSGDDGLDALRVLERRAAVLLRPGGVLGAEHADVQGSSAPDVLSASGRWRDVRDHRDLAGRARFVTARLAR